MIKIYNKLVRDRIPAIIKKNGHKVKYRKLKDDEYKQALKDKLLEEVKEFLAAQTHDEMIEELEDINLVLLFIKDEYKINSHMQSVIGLNKLIEKGSFHNRYFLESVEEKDSQ